MDIEEEKTHRKTLHTYKAPSSNVKMMKTLPGRACLLFIFHSQSQKNSWCSIIDCQFRSVFDLRQLSIAKLVENSMLLFPQERQTPFGIVIVGVTNKS
jgi:hypothetical protein